MLAAAKKDPTPKTFGELARDHSMDKATAMRGGNLGFRHRGRHLERAGLEGRRSRGAGGVVGAGR